MNADRRKKLAAISSQISNLVSEIEAIRDDEQEAFDNLPENLQGAATGEAMENAIAEMEEAISELENAGSTLDNVS